MLERSTTDDRDGPRRETDVHERRGPSGWRRLSARTCIQAVTAALLAVIAFVSPVLAATPMDPHFSPLAEREALAALGRLGGATFDPDALISDANFRAVSSMSQADVQAFLEARGGLLGKYTAPDVNGAVKPAGQIIWEAAQAFQVSPRVVLVTLQKEQGLLTDPAPSAAALAWAMGCGSPSSFGAQVWWGTDSLSVDGKGWKAGVTVKCGDGAVVPVNASTGSLYRYTPWIGLAGGGNKLFWTLYRQYFGDPLGDITAPTTTVTGADSAWHSPAVTLSFAAADDSGGSGVAYTEYSLNAGASWTKAGSVTIAAPASHAGDGVHTVSYRSVDRAGNVEAAKTCKVRIDTTPPRTSDNAGVAWHRAAVTVTLTAADPKPGAAAGVAASSSGVAYTEYSSDGGATWTRGSAFTVAAPSDHTSDGSHRFLYRSADRAGVVEAARSCVVNIDTRAPRPYANAPASVVRGHTATLRYYVSDARPGSPSATVVIMVRSLAGSAGKTLVVSGPVDRSLTARFVCRLAKGTYSFTVYATDAAGNPQAVAASNRLVVR